jgi:hypothetical protein
MNTNILKKCIDELKKESDPNYDYVLGMLEALYEMHTDTVPHKEAFKAVANDVFNRNLEKITDKPIDEGAVLDAKARAALETIKDVALPE